jgi:hypothetical protein
VFAGLRMQINGVNQYSIMKTSQFLLGTVMAVFVFGAYFLGFFHGQGGSVKWRASLQRFFNGVSVFGTVTRTGLAWAIALPAAWLMFYYGFIAHTWYFLGRWPRFGEHLQAGPLTIHREVMEYFGGALFRSISIVFGVMLVCLFLRRWRHVATYALCYCVALMGAAMAMFWLAPHDFLNWYFD